MSLDKLPKDILLELFKHLSPDDISLSMCCKHWYHTLQSDDDFWRLFIRQYEMHYFFPDFPPREVLMRWYLRFSSVIDVYPEMLSLFKRATEYVPRDSFSEGCNPEEFDLCLPDDIKCFYLMANGQNGILTPLFGSYSFYDHYMRMTMITLENSMLIKFPVNGLDPFIFSRCGNKVYFIHENKVYVNSSNFRTYYQIGDSFSSFLSDHLTKVETGYYGLVNDEFSDMLTINLFPMKDIPQAVTNGIVIKASPMYIHEKSSLNNHFWSYKIILEMDENESENKSCVLISRHWEITDESGNVDVVDGSGVIGLYPEVYPGSHFSYESCCSLSSPGKMQGWFTMKYPDGSTINAIVPPFYFIIPPSVSITNLLNTSN
eukprot:TRINITY_DN5103_c0_g1_i1.p1 TRINITY_DN5103_c0_g1~~TRINITY_DN5103_c0_g1_i1.p1  ORF type:complete len:374 (-),score=54.15 TRINITY_DN5103_c0_g1_i1:32-1153(-)